MASPELFFIFQKLSILIFTLAAWKLKVKVGFLSEIWYSLLHVHICFLTVRLLLNTASCVTEAVTSKHFSPFNRFVLGRKRRNEAIKLYSV